MIALGTVVRFTGRVRDMADGEWVCIRLPDPSESPMRAKFVRLGGSDNKVWTVTLDSVEILAHDAIVAAGRSAEVAT